ncbi:MAG: MarR family transcriptional regulator, partial [Promethearchaeota archaeon]
QSSAQMVEILLYVLTRTSQKTLSASQILVLKQLCDNPQLSVSQLNKQIKLSRPTITKILRQLRKDFGLKSGNLVDYSKFKLTTFNLIFHTKSYEDSRELENWIMSTSPPFLKTLVFDIDYRNGYLAFAIPTQQRALQAFKHRARWLQQEFMEQTHLHQYHSLFWNLQFDNYDLNQGVWKEPIVLTNQTSTVKSDIQETSDAHFQHSIQFGNAIKFTQSEYLLANAELKGAYSLNEKRDLLNRFGFTFSEKTVWAHLQRLKNQKVLAPYVYISDAGFEEFICISVQCEEDAYAPLKLLSSCLPFTYTYFTDCGIALYLKKPIGWSDISNRLINRISQIPGIYDIMVVHQERNVGSAAEFELYRRWNEKRQFWEFNNQDI